MERDDDCEGQFLRNLLTDFETDESTHFIIAIFFPVQNDNRIRFMSKKRFYFFIPAIDIF